MAYINLRRSPTNQFYYLIFVMLGMLGVKDSGLAILLVSVAVSLIYGIVKIIEWIITIAVYLLVVIVILYLIFYIKWFG